MTLTQLFYALAGSTTALGVGVMVLAWYVIPKLPRPE